ncbi:MAG: site-specific integrase [Geobacter sp.]|nr:site-specific integrase [Geobacter sp.]
MESLVDEYMQRMLDADKQDRYEVFDTPLDKVAHEQQQVFRDKFLLNPKEHYLLLEEATGEQVEVPGADNLASYYRRLASGNEERSRQQDFRDIAPLASGLLKIEKIQLPEDSPKFKLLCDALLAKEAEAYKILADRAEHGLNNAYDREHVSSSVQTRKKFTVLLKKYLSIHPGRSNARSNEKPNEHFGKILELLGNPYTDDISQDMLNTLFDELTRYPKWRNHDHLKGLSLEQCYQHPGYQPLDIETFKGVWHALGALLSYGSESGEFGICRNYCRDKIFSMKMRVLSKTKSKSDNSGRKPYSRENIQALIDQLTQRSNPLRNPHMLWIPLIALYNGMRQSEICQLFCDDIVRVTEIDCFRIRDCAERHQSVKNEQSQRTIPIHPTLIKLGFLEYVESCQKLKHERLWQGMKSRPVDYYAPQDNYSHYFEKWYNGTFRKYVFAESEEAKQKPFHSLRHTFINWFFQNIRYQDRDNAAVKSLVGHLESEELKLITASLKGITWDVYSDELNPSKMLETLQQLDYCVDLKPLGLPLKS